MKQWIIEQVRGMLILLVVCTFMGALEWITFAVLGVL